MRHNKIISPIVVNNLKNNLSQPICNANTIKKISNYLISKSRYRDNLIIILVVNFGIPIKTLLSLKFSDLYNNNNQIFDMFQKDTNTLTDISVAESIKIHRDNLVFNSLNHYVFQSVSGNNYGMPMSVEAVNNTFRQVREELNLTCILTYTSLIKTYLFNNQNCSTNNNLPIKCYDDIFQINDYLLQNQKYRDSVLFLIGINTGLKISELIQLKFSDFINPSGSFKEEYTLTAKGFNSGDDISIAYMPINDTIKTSISLYRDSLIKMFPRLNILDYYMFISHSGNGYYNNKPIGAQGVKTIIHNITKETGFEEYNHIEIFRKTFLYHQISINHNNSNILSFLQLMFKFKKTIDMFSYADYLPCDVVEQYTQSQFT